MPYAIPDGVSDEEDLEPCISAMCHDVGAAATVVFGPDALYYTLHTGNGVGQITLLLDSFSEPLPDLELVDVFVKLPRLLQDVDEVAWSLDGLARFSPGWRLEPGRAYDRTHEYRLFDATGAWTDLAVSFDAQQRVENVKLQGITRPQ